MVSQFVLSLIHLKQGSPPNGRDDSLSLKGFSKCSKRTTAVCFFILGVFSTQLNAQNAPRIIIEKQQAVAVAFQIDGNPDSWHIYKEGSSQSLLAKKIVSKDTLLFRPVIAFQPGITYVIKQNDTIKYRFSPQQANQSRPQVVHIYPTSENLPANLLKFYIQFSEPMAEGDPYNSIHLIGAAGDTLADIFLKQLPALWNRDRTILSLWLDPGRIKRDLNLNRKFGNPLEVDTNYHLVIDKSLKSRNGLPLRSGTQKMFKTTSADREKPETKSWNIDIPEKESTQPLIIHFNETMDYLSTNDRFEIWINGKMVKGESSFRNEEKEWVFTPAHNWEQGSYTLRADARIEDLAGNNLNRLFDRDIKTQALAEKDFYTITFKM